MQLQLGATYAEKYRIVRVLGEGAMGAVYEAENLRIHRRVAIKILHPQIAQKADTLRRFEREAQAAGRIGSKHIIEVLDLGELHDGSRFMVMEFLEGTTLDQRIRSKGRLTPEDATPIIAQLLEGLGAAHDAGIIHRDLKPANIFLTKSRGVADFVKILDFGVSKFNVLNEEMSMTSTGAVLGTPYYMSPEQAKGSRQVDPRSDLYAVGVILYECITGQVPFSAETFNELIFRIVLESPPPVESFVPNLDPAFTALIHKAMAREANDRFQTAAEFRMAILKWAEAASAGPVLPSALGLGGPMPGGPKPGGPALGVGGTMLMDPPSAGGPALDPDNARTMAMVHEPRPMPSPFQQVPPPMTPAPPGYQPRPAPPTAVLPTYADPSAQGAPMIGNPQGMQGAALYAAQVAQTVPNPQQAGPFPEAPYEIPKRSSGALAFVLGLLGVVILGGVAVAALKWSGDKNAASASPGASAAASELAASSPAPSASASASSTALASASVTAPPATAAPSAPEPVAVAKPPSTAVGRPAGTATTPPSHPTSKVPAGPSKTPGKRTISTEL
jgi:tRNA A-37 threonylcarbamoyl transferase component Bud32